MNYNFYRILEENFPPTILWYCGVLYYQIYDLLSLDSFQIRKEYVKIVKSLSISLTFLFMILLKVFHPTQLQGRCIFFVMWMWIYCFEFLMHGFLLSWLIYNLLNKSWRQWRMKHNLLPSYIKQPLPHLLPSLWWGQWLSTLSSSHSSLPVTPICHFLPFTKNWKWYVSLRNYADN